MKKACFATLAFLLMVTGAAAQDDESYYAASYARLNYVSGDVFVQRTSDLGYEKGEVNLALVQGDKIATEIGHAEVHFGGRNYLRIDQYSQVEFAQLPREGDDGIKLHVLEGGVYLRVSRLAYEKAIEIHTPDASFYLLEEGLYRVNVRPERESELVVLEGSAEAAGEEGSVLVRTEESISAIDGRFLGAPERFFGSPDEFGEWNGTRDDLLAERSDTRYLPSDLDDYEEELDRSGRWVYERPYGYVWTPYAVNADWRPYLYGRWVWYPMIGWNWVSFEPWGWAVYHYGRWHWRIGLGWYWIPHSHWRPAWVHWWHHQSYIGWCPLSWYNRPVVIVNNHFYDRYYDPSFPAGNRAMTVIRRNQLQSPNVARHVVARTELTSVGRISLRAQGPSLKPAANVSNPVAVRAQKALTRSSARIAPKHYNPASAPDSAGRSIARENPSALRRGTLSGAPGSSADPPKGVIRSFPSRQSASQPAAGESGSRTSGVARSSRPAVGSPPSSAGSGSAKSAKGVAPAPSKTGPSGKSGQVGKGTESSGRTVKKESKIKTYASTSAKLSSSAAKGGGPGASAPARSRVTTSYPSRLQAPRQSSSQNSSRSSAPRTAFSNPTRSSNPASTPRAPKASVRTSQPSKAGSVSRLPKSTSSSSRSISPRTAPSSSRSSVSRPSSSRSSAPRSVSSPKSSASRSGSGSVSKSSSSGGKSGTVRKKD